MKIPHDPKHDLRVNCFLSGNFTRLKKKMSEIWSDVLVQECCKREGGKGKGEGEGKVDQISHQNSYLGVTVGMTLDCYDKKQSSKLNGKLGPLSLHSKNTI